MNPPEHDVLPGGTVDQPLTKQGNVPVVRVPQKIPPAIEHKSGVCNLKSIEVTG